MRWRVETPPYTIFEAVSAGPLLREELGKAAGSRQCCPVTTGPARAVWTGGCAPHAKGLADVHHAEKYLRGKEMSNVLDSSSEEQP